MSEYLLTVISAVSSVVGTAILIHIAYVRASSDDRDSDDEKKNLEEPVYATR